MTPFFVVVGDVPLRLQQQRRIAKEIMTQSTQRYEVHVERNVPVPMRDGTVLRAEVYRPKAEGKWPVIVMRNGYDPVDDVTFERGTFFSQCGYVFVFNNTRGTFQSEGVFFPFIDDSWGKERDGYDHLPCPRI